jgi:hypothetical protein
VVQRFNSRIVQSRSAARLTCSGESEEFPRRLVRFAASSLFAFRKNSKESFNQMK